jgi:hypothetical protein
MGMEVVIRAAKVSDWSRSRTANLGLIFSRRSQMVSGKAARIKKVIRAELRLFLTGEYFLSGLGLISLIYSARGREVVEWVGNQSFFYFVDCRQVFHARYICIPLLYITKEFFFKDKGRKFFSVGLGNTEGWSLYLLGVWR